MKTCEFCGEQEKCPQYNETESRPGYVNLTCWWLREIWRNNWKCTAPPPKKVDK